MSPVRCELGFYIPEDGVLHSHRRENLRSYPTTLHGITFQTIDLPTVSALGTTGITSGSLVFGWTCLYRPGLQTGRYCSHSPLEIMNAFFICFVHATSTATLIPLESIYVILEECRLVRCGAEFVLLDAMFRRNLLLPFSGWKESASGNNFSN
jgi:hypothetical protein